VLLSEHLEISKIQATGRHCAIFSCSAWEAPETIEAGFTWVVTDIAKRVYVLE
jgi:hypothetical protein